MIGHRQLTFDDYWAILRRRRWVLMVPAVLGAALAYLISLILPNQYTSQTLVLVTQPTVPESYVKPVVTEDLSQRLTTMQEQILSRSRLEPIIQRFGLYKNEINRVPMEDLVNRLRKTIQVTPIEPMAETRARDLPGFYVNVTANEARLAQQICAEVTSMFMEENLRLRQEQAEDTTQFLSKQLEDAKVKLDEQDGKLAVFKRRYIGELPEDGQTNLSLLTGLNTQLDAANQALARAQQDKSFAESMLSQQLAAWQASQAGQSPETLEKELSDLQNQLVRLQASYTDDYPDVVKLKNDIAQLKKKIAANDAQSPLEAQKPKEKPSVEPAQIVQLRAQIHQYEQIIHEKSARQEEIQQEIKLYQGRIQLSPMVEQQYKELTRDYQTALDLYNDLLRKRSQSAMATDLERRQQSEQFRVLDPASLPQKPSFPNRRLFAFGGLGGGLALGICIAFVLEMRDTTLRSERDVEFFLKVPTLAMVPSVNLGIATGTGRCRDIKGNGGESGQGARI